MTLLIYADLTVVFLATPVGRFVVPPRTLDWEDTTRDLAAVLTGAMIKMSVDFDDKC